jgi:hypothetical protein
MGSVKVIWAENRDFWDDLFGRSELPHDATPVPTQVSWLPETTNNVQ